MSPDRDEFWRLVDETAEESDEIADCLRDGRPQAAGEPLARLGAAWESLRARVANSADQR